MIDGRGIYGFIFHYALLFALFFGALVAFLIAWRKKRLDFDDELKYQPFHEEEENHE